MPFVRAFLYVLAVALIFGGGLTAVGVAAFLCVLVIRDSSGLESVIIPIIGVTGLILAAPFLVALIRGYTEEELRWWRSRNKDLSRERRQLITGAFLGVLLSAGLSVWIATTLIPIAESVIPWSILISYSALFVILSVGLPAWIVTRSIAKESSITFTRFWFLFLLGTGLFTWSIGVKAAAGVFFGGVAALLLRSYFKRLEANHVFDFLEHMHPHWALFLLLLIFLAVLFPFALLLDRLFGEHSAEQVMMGVLVGAIFAIIVRPSFVQHRFSK